MHKLRADSVQVDSKAAALSPYIRSYISRFDQYILDLSRTPPPVHYELPILGSVSSDHGSPPASLRTINRAMRHKWPQNAAIVVIPL